MLGCLDSIHTLKTVTHLISAVKCKLQLHSWMLGCLDAGDLSTLWRLSPTVDASLDARMLVCLNSVHTLEIITLVFVCLV